MSNQVGLQEREAIQEELAPVINPLHQHLIQIWEDLLHVQSIGIKDDFFELGGHSLLAIQMLNRIRQVCGKKLPLTTLYEGATIEHLAKMLTEESVEKDLRRNPHWRTPLVAVQKGGSLRPFFYLHGDWKDGSFYSIKMARGIGPDRPFYNLEPYIFDDQQVPPTLEAIAAAYIQTIREVQPEGPYLLGGFCNGALIAYEMACQITEAGQEVEQLLMINPAIPTPRSRVSRFMRQVGRLIRLPEDIQLDLFLLGRKLRRVRQRTRRILNIARGNQLAIEDELERRKIKQQIDKQQRASRKQLRQDWSSIYDWVVLGTSLYRYTGKVTLIWSESEGNEGPWEQMTRTNEREIYRIPGTHRSCRTKHLQSLIDCVRRCLDQARGKDDERIA